MNTIDTEVHVEQLDYGMGYAAYYGDGTKFTAFGETADEAVHELMCDIEEDKQSAIEGSHYE